MPIPKWKSDLIKAHQQSLKPYRLADDYDNVQQQDEASLLVLETCVTHLLKEVVDSIPDNLSEYCNQCRGGDIYTPLKHNLLTSLGIEGEEQK